MKLVTAGVAVFSLLAAVSSRALPAAGTRAIRSSQAAKPAAQAPIDFERDIRPIFEVSCYACHGEAKHKGGLRLDRKSTALAGSSSGRVIEPGDGAGSALMQRVTSTDAEERMPQGKDPLGAREVALLRAWIDQGAIWPDDGSDTASTDRHWAYVKPVQSAPPVIAGISSPIDRFIRDRLKKEGLEPAPEADRQTLIRRASLDLTGLPPTPAEIDAFVHDARPDAYERLVDQLLASPRYGERQAQRWLDLARYADTNGYEKDERRTMWRYRDWVIDAFNRNMPFDRFTIEQIAGDLLPNATLDQRIATGFHRNTLMNEEGGTDPEEFRNAAVVDRVNTTATVWLGTTLACAQCHNHKYDPFSTKEYYELFAFFDSTVDTGNKNDPMIAAPSPEQTQEEQRLAARVDELKRELAAPDRALDAEEEEWIAKIRPQLPASTAWRVLVPADVKTERGSAHSVLPDGSVLAGGKLPDSETYTLTAVPSLARVDVVRIEVLTHESLPTGGPGRSPNGNFVLTDVVFEVVESGRGVRAPFRAAEASFEQAYGGRFRVGEAIDADRTSGWAIDRGQSDTRDEQALFVLDRPVELPKSAQIRVTLTCESTFGQHLLGRFRVSVADDEALARRVAPPEMGAWRALGPIYASSQDAALTTVFPPEAEIVARGRISDEYEVPRPGPRDPEEKGPSSSFFAWIGQPTWRDGDAHTLVGENCAHYLMRTLHCDEATSLDLYAGADDALRLWVDGVQVLETQAMQGPVADQHKVQVKLEPGQHTIALKVVNGPGDCSFFFDVVRSPSERLSAEVIDALNAEHASDAQLASVRAYFRRTQSPRGRELTAALASAEKALDDTRAKIPTALVMQELDQQRQTHVHVRGSFLNPGEEVQPGVPRVLNPLGPFQARPTRLDLARWLVDPENPLTARVVVNRAWEELFGRGLVATSDDFGTRGEPPSHPELLDWMSVELVRNKWDMKALLRSIVTSATYRQSSRVTPELLERDPKNVYLARAPRMRMEIETLRDVALAIGGLLKEKIGGPSVMPPQPEGIWTAAYSGDKWTNATESDRFRRGLYTFWRRSSPYATYTLFDAPSRELSCTRRPRTETPLQALALLNDPAFVECAAGLALRMMRETQGGDAERIAFGFRLCTARDPAPDEIAVLAALRQKELVRLANKPADAKKTVEAVKAALKPDDATDPIELAAWIAVGNVLLNMDETVTRN